MEMLTYIYTKWQQKMELTKEDLCFLYEIDSKIIEFGYRKDPRIKEIVETRDKKIDLSKIFDCKKDQISLTEEEALNGNIIYHYDKLDLSDLTSAEGITLPQSVGGTLDLSSLTNAEGLIFPQNIGGGLILNSLTSAEGLTLPQSVGGTLWLSSLTSAEGLTLPQSVGGYIDLRSLTSAEGLILPQNVRGHLWLDSLTSAEGLILPQNVGEYIDLESLTSAEGLTIPDTLNCILICPIAEDINELREMCKKNNKKK